MLVNSGDKVRYIGGGESIGNLRHGAVCVVFGYNSVNPSSDGVFDRSRPTLDRDQISIYVDDPTDRYGGVLAYDVSLFGVPQWERIEEQP